MIALINPLAEAYATGMSTATTDELLKEVYEKTLHNHTHAHMQSSYLQGSILRFISKLLQPKYILEIGTFTGFSALCLAEGLLPTGELHTIEIREQDALTAKDNFSKSKRANQLILHVGNAIDIIPTLPYTWDIVFIDADKTAYIDYYEMVLPLLSNNGIIIADNVLFHGQVLTTPVKGKNALAIDNFNKHVAADERTEQILLTVRDGLTIIKKK